ncbi:hypothetical protein DFH06DRAFT_1447192 [Mycena polygramma]|nr:hypothetical protein DFH06DRAFT_1447192 [Mycena polygramma]
MAAVRQSSTRAEWREFEGKDVLLTNESGDDGVENCVPLNEVGTSSYTGTHLPMSAMRKAIWGRAGGVRRDAMVSADIEGAVPGSCKCRGPQQGLKDISGNRRKEHFTAPGRINSVTVRGDTYGMMVVWRKGSPDNAESTWLWIQAPLIEQFSSKPPPRHFICGQAGNAHCLRIPEINRSNMLSSPAIPRSHSRWRSSLRPCGSRENMHHLQGSSSRSLVERQLRPIHPSDWDRLRLYAPRVKTLGSGFTWSLHNVFPSLNLVSPIALFRNLQTLNWEQDDVNFHHIHMFLRPTLTRINFRLCSDPETASSLLAILMKRCPKLTEIFISSGHLHLRPVSRFVLDLQAVEALSIPGLDQDALEHLSQLQTLKLLSLESPPRFTSLRTSRPNPNFPALRTLRVNSPTITPMAHFFRTCRNVSLETCHMTLFNYFTVAELCSFVDRLSGAVSHSSLAELSVEIDREPLHDPDPALYTVLPDTLCLLFCFSNLTYLALSSLLGFDFDDEAVEQMARAWPRMEVLDLSTPMCCDTPRTTPACLQIFARHCPRLSSLTMAFNGTVVPEATLTSAAYTPHERLRDLDVQHSPITSAVAMAHFFLGSFPNLTGISTNWEFYDGVDVDEFPEQREWVGYLNCWKEVHTLLAELREESASPQSHGATNAMLQISFLLYSDEGDVPDIESFGRKANSTGLITTPKFELADGLP